MSICICGDTHGINDFRKIKMLAKKKKLSYGDYIIICGDAGIVWSNDSLKTNIFFVDGNHEDFDMLNHYNIEVWSGVSLVKVFPIY
ncbi:MAG: hypothetical protein PHX62_00040 [Bacilli bacterium]|nr:hypothetical protein [Bacilli bacterium]